MINKRHMKFTLAIISLSLCTILSGGKKDARTVYRLQGLTLENYPHVDGSTSTEPLHMLM